MLSRQRLSPESGGGEDVMACISPDLSLTEHLWNQFGRAGHVNVTNRTTLADLQQLLDEE